MIFSVVDSDISYAEAVLSNLHPDCPLAIKDRQVLQEVYYWGFDGATHRGQIVIDKDLANDVEQVFTVAYKAKFPIHSVIPISQFGWSDDASMDANNSSGFNYRMIAGTDKLSLHARGMAIDINPKLNPFCHKDGSTSPHNAVHEPGKPGVLVAGDPVVSKFKELGWTWGGDWGASGSGIKDWQHFEKNVAVG